MVLLTLREMSIVHYLMTVKKPKKQKTKTQRDAIKIIDL